MADKPTKNAWGLVRMDETSKLQQKLKKKKELKQISPRFWRKDWNK